MNLKLETEFSKAEILRQVDALKKQIDEMRPLPKDVEDKVMQKLRLDWNYNSNAIEGNKLSYGETTALLMHGITAKGKPLKDHLDIEGHNKAIEYLEEIVRDNRRFTEVDIRTLHEVILVSPSYADAQTADGIPTKKQIQIGKYKSVPNHVITVTGATHYYATPEETPAKMNDLMDWFNTAINDDAIHPVVTAALFHHKFVAIHPFDDGNGRLSRALVNLILMQNGYPPVVIKTSDKQNYYSLLSQADVGDNWPFVEYIINRLQDTLHLFLKAANGGDVDEDEDVDKQIALLSMQLNGNIVAKEKKSREAIKRIFFESIFPLSVTIENKLKIFENSFFVTQHMLVINYLQRKHKLSQTLLIKDSLFVTYENILDEKLFHDIGFQLNFRFLDYKDPKNRFNLLSELTIVFEEFYYKIIVDQEPISATLYHEKLAKLDSDKIVKKIVLNLGEQISSNLKSPKS